eukprot:gene42967-52511_t
MASFVSAALTAFHLALDAFRISTLEVDSYPLLVAETALSLGFTGAAYYLASHLQYPVPSALLNLVHLGFIQHLRGKYVHGKKYEEVDLTGKVYIVTGANTGIGYETAKHLVRMNGTVIMACRSADRAQEAKDKIIREIQCAPSKIIFVSLDLSSLASVRAFAQKFLDLKLPLHALILNAGLMLHSRSETVDGFESNFQCNHLGHFLLTQLLLGALRSTSGGARVVTLTSVLHKFPKRYVIEDVNSKKGEYEMFRVYQQSKLANIIFTKELHRRYGGGPNGLFVCSVHPGCVRTEVTRNMSPLMRWGDFLAAPVLSLLQKTPHE